MKNRWGRWFRVYDDFIEDPKFLKISESSQLILVKIWAISSKFDGILPAFPELRIKLRVHKDRLTRALSELQEAGLIDCTDKGLSPHNWDARQFRNDLSTERVKRFRKRRETVSRNRSKRFSETETEVEKGKIPLKDFPRSLPAERVSGNVAEAAASGAPPGGCAPAAAADPEAEMNRVREEAERENLLRDRNAEEWRLQKEFLEREVARLGLNGQAH